MKTRVLHLLRSNIFSGAENVVCQIISMLADENIDMVYCSPDGAIRSALADRDVPFLPLADFSASSLKKALAAYRPNVIHAHDAAASVLAAHVADKRIRIISQVHGNDEKMRIISPKSLLYRRYSRRFSHVFWVSETALRDYRFAKSVQNKSTVLKNILRSDALLAASREEGRWFDIIFLGRLSYPKNPTRLVGVFSRIRKQCPNATLGIVGDGEMRAEVEAAVRECGLLENVTLLGFQKNPLPILKNATLMLMSSRYEGVPMCALEAMGLGVPIVSTPTDGLREVVDDGETGYLREDDEGLAACAATLLCDPALRERFSQNSLKKASVWNDERAYADALLTQYTADDCRK